MAHDPAGREGATSLPLSEGSAPRGGPADAPGEPPGYRLPEPLGRGGMGIVRRARQLATGRDVAFKFATRDPGTGLRAVRRFEREVELCARLRHPHIAAVYDSGLHRGLCYYAMELVEGVPLDRHAARHGLNSPEFVRLMRTVCRAFQHAQERGVIHRD